VIAGGTSTANLIPRNSIFLSRWAGNGPHRRTRERSATFTIQYFANLSGNEGKAFLDQKNVTTNQKCNGTFTFTAAAPIGTQNATATSTRAGSHLRVLHERWRHPRRRSRQDTPMIGLGLVRSSSAFFLPSLLKKLGLPAPTYG
jgi:hypothetical protein